MGRRTVASFDDVLLQKCSTVIVKVLDELHSQGELEHVDLLYPPGTFPRHPSSDNTQADGPSSRPAYTFEHFVDHLDVKDGTFSNLIELLVTTTARKAIARAAHLHVEETGEGRHQNEQSLRASAEMIDRFRTSTAAAASSSSAVTIMDRAASMRTARACQREMMRNRALQGEIRGITRRSRRLSRAGSTDSSASEGIQGLAQSPPLTRTVFSSLLDPPSSYPPLQSVITGADGATTRAARVGHGSTTYRWLQRDLSSIRRRSQRQEFSLANSGSITSPPARPHESFHVADSSNTLQGEGPDMSIVRRFLNQPWSTDAQRPGGSVDTVDGHSQFDITLRENAGLDATLAPTLDIERRSSSPDLFTNAALSLDPTGVDVEGEVAMLGDPTVGSQARLDAIQAALNRVSSSVPLPSSDPIGQMSLATLPPSYEIVGGGRGDPISDFSAYSARQRHAQRSRRAEQDRRQRNQDDFELGREHQAALDRALANLTEADETISRIVRRANDSSLSAAIDDVSVDAAHNADAASSPRRTRNVSERPTASRNRARAAGERRISSAANRGDL